MAVSGVIISEVKYSPCLYFSKVEIGFHLLKSNINMAMKFGEETHFRYLKSEILKMVILLKFETLFLTLSISIMIS